MEQDSGPKHYTYAAIQPIDVVEEWDLDYCLGSVLKYIGRHRHKGTPIKDLKKALWFLQRKIDNLESE